VAASGRCYSVKKGRLLVHAESVQLDRVRGNTCPIAALSPPKHFFVLIKCLVLRQVELFLVIRHVQNFLVEIMYSRFKHSCVWFVDTFFHRLLFGQHSSATGISHNPSSVLAPPSHALWESLTLNWLLQRRSITKEERKNLVARQNISFQPKYYTYWIESNNSIEWPAAMMAPAAARGQSALVYYCHRII
jgi:hypothetical protein